MSSLPVISISGNVVAVSGTVSITNASLNVSISGQPVSISGQPVVASVTTNISGQSVRLPNDGVNNIVYHIGQTVVANVNVGNVQISGNIIRLTDVSGFPIETIDVGGERYLKAWISGQKVDVSVSASANISGQSVRLTDTDGDPLETIVVDGTRQLRVSISGQPVTATVQAGPTKY